MKEIIEKAKELAKQESGKAVRPLFDIANQMGQVLAEKLNADNDLVMLGTLLMDLKLKQAMAENRIQDHTQMSLEAAKEFLEQFDLDEETVKKILACVTEHHGAEKFTCIESEICANADCYKFLHPKGILIYVGVLNERLGDLKKAIEGVKAKMDEKYNILSLDICKEELDEYYKAFQKIFEKAKEL